MSLIGPKLSISINTKFKLLLLRNLLSATPLTHFLSLCSLLTPLCSPSRLAFPWNHQAHFYLMTFALPSPSVFPQTSIYRACSFCSNVTFSEKSSLSISPTPPLVFLLSWFVFLHSTHYLLTYFRSVLLQKSRGFICFVHAVSPDMKNVPVIYWAFMMYEWVYLTLNLWVDNMQMCLDKIL